MLAKRSISTKPLVDCTKKLQEIVKHNQPFSVGPEQALYTSKRSPELSGKLFYKEHYTSALLCLKARKI